jgi:hypothetical protein
MVSDGFLTCRKCGVPNPPGNQYCKKCGAVLSVSTTILKAQRKPVKPQDTGFKWRYVWVGGFVMLGLAAVAIGTAIFLGLRVQVEERGVVGGLAAFAVALGVVFLISFGISGFLLGLLAKRAVPREAFVAAALVVTLLGVIGSTVTYDLAITAGLLLLPTGFSAWLGSRLRGRE